MGNSPDFVNDIGVKWWKENLLTEYALSKGLKDISVWITQHPDGQLMRVIIQNDEIIFENTKLEDIGSHIDMLALSSQ